MACGGSTAYLHLMPKTSASAAPRAADPISSLIQAQRNQREWSLARLAAAAGLHSPSYVFHIENGSKTPSPAVASRLAVALGLDSGLLVAWATARGRADLASALAAASRVSSWLGESEGNVSARPRASESLETQVAPSAGGSASLPGSPGAGDAIEVPILAEGADPFAGDLADRAIETIRIERALLPPLEVGARLAGYRLSAHGARRIPEALRAGDCVIVLLGMDLAGPDAPCAVRVGTRVEIMRRQAEKHAAHLPPPRSATDSESSAGRAAPADGGTVVGRVVLAIRRWL